MTTTEPEDGEQTNGESHEPSEEEREYLEATRNLYHEDYEQTPEYKLALQRLQQSNDQLFTASTGDNNNNNNNNNDNNPGGNNARVRRQAVTLQPHAVNLSYRPGRIIVYSQPRQRQRWGDTQVLPRTNWGDLFFDLFYVAATYNVSNILVENPTKTGLLYAVATFAPVMNIWSMKAYYDARFVTEDDLYHRLFQELRLVLLGTAVLHIRPVKYLSNPSDEISMFVFSLVLILHRLSEMILAVEIYLFGVGQNALKKTAVSYFRNNLVPLAFFALAMVLSALDYFDNRTAATSTGLDSDSSGHYRFLASTAVAATNGGYLNETSDCIYSNGTVCGGDETSDTNSTDQSYGDSTGGHGDTVGSNYGSYGKEKDTTDLPILLVLLGHVFSEAILFIETVFFFPGGGKHKKFMVPANVDFMMHRHGEWIMLMFGESVFSLLIVEPYQEHGFYATLFAGVITMILLQFLHFRSQPHNPDCHAIRRDKNAGVTWHLLVQVYSFALVALGAAFTVFLTSFAYDDDDASARRFLAGGGDANLDHGTLAERGAHLYCGSLAVIFFCLDVLIVLHLGLDEGLSRLLGDGSIHSVNVEGLVLVALRCGVLVFSATMSQWETNPDRLAEYGLFCVFSQLMLRKFGGTYLAHKTQPTLEGGESATPGGGIGHKN